MTQSEMTAETQVSADTRRLRLCAQLRKARYHWAKGETTEAAVQAYEVLTSTDRRSDLYKSAARILWLCAGGN